MPFTHDWFSHNTPNWSKWLASFKGQPCCAVEVGCYEGLATCWLLENILTHPESSIIVMDTFAGSEEHHEFGVGFENVCANFLENVKPWYGRVRLFTGRSDDVLRHLSGPFDIAYIDGSHIAADVLTDICMAWPIMSPGAVVILDDYQWDHYQDPARNPRMGIDAFLNAFAGRYQLVAKEYQVCVKKL